MITIHLKFSWKNLRELLCNPAFLYLHTMDVNYSIEDWEELIYNSNLSKNDMVEKMYYVKNAFQNNVPVILDQKHLSALVGLKVGVLNNMINSPKSFYRNFSIPKKSGGLREIVTPYKSLLETQKWILENILCQYKIHDAAFAYQKGKNVAMNSSVHIGSNEMLKIDLKDFFPSVIVPMVRDLFINIGYSKKVAQYLTNLCCLNYSIPQGAATSPQISNIVLFNLDSKLQNLSSQYGIKYTRYADDLVFSSDKPMPELFITVKNLIEEEGFRVNQKKTRYYTQRHRKMVTGIIVSEEKISLPKSKKREIKKDVYFLTKYGILEQVKKYNDIYLADRVLGKLSYWKQIEPQNQYVLSSIKTIKNMYRDLINSLTREN